MSVPDVDTVECDMCNSYNFKPVLCPGCRKMEIKKIIGELKNDWEDFFKRVMVVDDITQRKIDHFIREIDKRLEGKYG